MANWSDALGVVAKLAPTIAAAFGGPLAGGAVAALESVFGIGGNQNATDAERTASLAAAISGATPDQLLAIKKADQEYAVTMASLGFKSVADLTALQLKDVQGARDMQVATKSYTAPVLAWVFVIGFIIITVLKLTGYFNDADQSTHDLLTTLRDGLILILSYYFGSSASSREKSILLANNSTVQK